jgi:hypothetical protein
VRARNLLAIVLAISFAGLSSAVPSASAYGIPEAEWAQEHWMPFDEVTFYEVVGTTRRDVLNWGKRHDDKVPLRVMITKRKGLSFPKVVNALMERWDGLEESQIQRLRRRTVMILETPHLGQHMFGHTIHHRSVTLALPDILRVEDNNALNELRAQGLSVADVGQRNGLAVAEVEDAIIATIRRSFRRGIRRNAVSHREMRLRMSYVREEVHGYVVYRRPVHDGHRLLPLRYRA